MTRIEYSSHGLLKDDRERDIFRSHYLWLIIQQNNRLNKRTDMITMRENYNSILAIYC